MNMPLMVSMRGYKRRYIMQDIIAGLVVTAIAVPELMGIATMTGVPVQMGLYSAILAPIIFALFGVSRRLIVGADSATAVLLAGGAGALAAIGTPQYSAAIVTIGILSAVLLGIITIFRLTFLADLISKPVMIGFLAGVGIQLMVTQLPAMLGVQHATQSVTGSIAALGGIGAANAMAVTISILVIGVIIIFRGSRIPGALLGLVGAGVFAFLFESSIKGVAMVGALPQGLPGVTLPVLTLDMVVATLPVALSVAIVILAQSASVIRTMAAEHDERPDVPRDTAALSLAGVGSALTGGLAINASPPRSIAADFAGMRSQLASVVMSILIVALLLFCGGVFAYIPVAALAAVVFVMGYRLIRAREIVYLARHHKMEFTIAALACVGVLVFGVLTGIIIAVIASLMERLRREYHPADEILLKDGELSTWASERVLDLKHIPGDVLVFGFDASLFFENSQYFGHRLRKAIRSAQKPLRAVIVDTSAMDDIDYTAVEELKQIYRHLSVDGIRLGFSHVSPHLLEQFDNYGVVDLVGEQNIFPTLRAAIEFTPKMSGDVIARVKALKLPEGEYLVVGGAVMEVLNLRQSSSIDIVVSGDVYAAHAAKSQWHEYSLSSGKSVITKDNINLMRSWFGRSLGVLKRRDTFTKDGVLFMGPKQLAAIKQHLGRRKDQSDIVLLSSSQRREQP